MARSFPSFKSKLHRVGAGAGAGAWERRYVEALQVGSGEVILDE